MKSKNYPRGRKKPRSSPKSAKVRKKSASNQPDEPAPRLISFEPQEASLAIDILGDFNQEAWDFALRWIALNSIYNKSTGKTEKDRLVRSIESGIHPSLAGDVLRECAPYIQALSNLPPGDMRRNPLDPEFRKKATEHLQIASDFSQDSRTQIAHLACAVYQIRCNLFHGAKNPRTSRSRMLLRSSKIIIGSILNALIKSSEISVDA